MCGNSDGDSTRSQATLFQIKTAQEILKVTENITSFQALDFLRTNVGRKSRYNTGYKNRSETREKSQMLS